MAGLVPRTTALLIALGSLAACGGPDRRGETKSETGRTEEPRGERSTSTGRSTAPPGAEPAPPPPESTRSARNALGRDQVDAAVKRFVDEVIALYARGWPAHLPLDAEGKPEAFVASADPALKSSLAEALTDMGQVVVVAAASDAIAFEVRTEVTREDGATWVAITLWDRQKERSLKTTRTSFR